MYKAVMPIIFLLLSLTMLLVFQGADAINEYSPWVLLASSAFSLVLAYPYVVRNKNTFIEGMKTSFRQIFPAVPVLFCIALLSTTWMLGGIVPAFIHYGMEFLDARYFLVTVCVVCSCISVFTGSSWTTIATIGVAFMGIGEIMGYSAPWIAGAVISGAYFGDKVSPLSDTTVVASSSCGVDLFTHIRYMMFTTVPSIIVALLVFLFAGLNHTGEPVAGQAGMLEALDGLFVITPWVFLVPVVTLIMIAFRVKTFVTLAVSAAMGVVAMALFQPSMPLDAEFLSSLWKGAEFHTADEAFNNLASTSGLTGMLPTIFLVLSAMIFGGVMIGSGMLHAISERITKVLRKRSMIISGTVGSGLILNSITADQYLSIIIGANLYGESYRNKGYERKLLSRTLEDSISVTSVLIPWNSCGLTQSAVLGIGTLSYLPYCVFNYVSPLMSIAVSAGAVRIGSGIFRKLAKG